MVRQSAMRWPDMPPGIAGSDTRSGRHVAQDERGQRALRRLREATADHLSDVAFAGAEDDFRHRARVIPYTKALLIDSQISPYSNERTPRHIARGGIDNYLILLCLGGGVTFGSGRRSVTLRPGDLCLMDMAQANRTSVVPMLIPGSHIRSR